MNVVIDPVIAGRIRAAWALLPAAQREAILPRLEQSHQYLLALSRGRQPELPTELFDRELAYGITILANDRDGIVPYLSRQAETRVSPDGSILGTGKYEELDPGWLECFAEWLEHVLFGRARFVTNPVTVQMPDQVLIAVVGDWGTGDWRGAQNPSPSSRVRGEVAKLQPNITIHLGDVYYSGTAREEDHLLERLWPAGSHSSWALNSNHEMYSGGKPFLKAIKRRNFWKQEGCSYFALENANWIVVGLDSAYFANELGLYKQGALFNKHGGTEQVEFLKSLIKKRKRIIVLTHHNGLSLTGEQRLLLWEQTMSVFDNDSAPDYWYWGHAHSGVVYRPYQKGPSSVLCRCCGHGALPGARASVLDTESLPIVWHEQESADDPDISVRILNGFATILLTDNTIAETFYDETGRIAWRN